MISEETYNNMMENMHLIGNEENYECMDKVSDDFETLIVTRKKIKTL